MKRILAALVAAVVVGAGFAASASAYTTPKHLNQVASALANRPVKVRCLDAYESSRDTVIQMGAAAYVNYTVEFGRPARPLNYTVFSYPLCKTLIDLKKGRGHLWSADEVVWALMVLVHESGHLRGTQYPLWYDEGLVNCWALRRTSAIGVIWFGLPESVRPLVDAIARRIYLNQPPEYHNVPGCANQR